MLMVAHKVSIICQVVYNTQELFKSPVHWVHRTENGVNHMLLDQYWILVAYWVHLHSALKAYETLHNGQYGAFNTHSGNESNLVV